MAKMIAFRENGERVFLALMNNGTVLQTASGHIAGTKNTDEEISNALRELMGKEGIKAAEGAAALPDNACIMKEIDVTGMSAANLAMNLPYDFGEYVPVGQEINFVFDYQALPVIKAEKPKKPKREKQEKRKLFERKKMPFDGQKKKAEERKPDRYRILATAVSRASIAKQTEIAKDAGIPLVRLAPESVALGDLVETSPYRDKECCIISMGPDSTVIRIYRRFENIASHEINLGLRPVKGILADHNFTFFDGNAAQKSAIFDLPECMDVIRELVSQIAYVLDYFAERDFYHTNTEVFLAEEGATVTTISRELSSQLGRECRNVSALMKGKVRDEDAAMLAAAVGAGIFR